MKKLSLVLCVLGTTLFLTACGSSGSSNNATQACGIYNNQAYPYGTNGATNANCANVPAGYSYVNGQLVYTGAGATGVGYPYGSSAYGYGNPAVGGGYGYQNYGSNPCSVYGYTWTPTYSPVYGTMVCVSQYGY